MRGALLCVLAALMGGPPLIGARADNDAAANTEPTSESRQNIPQYANNFLHHRPQNHRYPYPSNPGYYPHNYGNGYGYGYGGQQQQQQQGLMEVLETIAARDELHCVSKILCDMASSGTRDNYGYKKPSGFINLDSLATLLSGVDDSLASPIVKFGKAFVLGYTAKHTSQCQYAYPRCPNDPDRLVHYLNSQQGGLIGLFNNQPSIFPTNRRIQSWGTRGHNANSFYIYDYGRDKRQYAWQFPSYDSQIHNYDNDGVLSHEKGKSLKFPNEHKYEKGYSESGSSSFYFPDNHLRTDEEISATQHNRGFVFRDF